VGLRRLRYLLSGLLRAAVPWKGQNLYEMQFGPVVVQWGHREPFERNGLLGTPLHIWKDRFWRSWIFSNEAGVLK